MLIESARLRSLIVSHVTVKRMVGTAASAIPLRPPSALASWLRTRASTVAVEGAPVCVGWRAESVTGAARIAG